MRCGSCPDYVYVCVYVYVYACPCPLPPVVVGSVPVVVKPEDGKDYPERKGYRETNPVWCRLPKKLDAMMVVMEEACNSKLRKEGHSELIREELVGGRLYTGPVRAGGGALPCSAACPILVCPAGQHASVRARVSSAPWSETPGQQDRFADPFASLCGAQMYMKYNIVLRSKSKDAAMVKLADKLTMGNGYPTTIHAINSCVIKLSKLTKAGKIWRGIRDAALPESFWVPNEMGVRGGIEYAFSSATSDREQALLYSKSDDGGASTIFEMQMGMVDRGADLTWLSQVGRADHASPPERATRCRSCHPSALMPPLVAHALSSRPCPLLSLMPSPLAMQSSPTCPPIPVLALARRCIAASHVCSCMKCAIPPTVPP